MNDLPVFPENRSMSYRLKIGIKNPGLIPADKHVFYRPAG
jgi:hypothetical protein